MQSKTSPMTCYALFDIYSSVPFRFQFDSLDCYVTPAQVDGNIIFAIVVAQFDQSTPLRTEHYFLVRSTSELVILVSNSFDISCRSLFCFFVLVCPPPVTT